MKFLIILYEEIVPPISCAAPVPPDQTAANIRPMGRSPPKQQMKLELVTMKKVKKSNRIEKYGRDVLGKYKDRRNVKIKNN